MKLNLKKKKDGSIEKFLGFVIIGGILLFILFGIKMKEIDLTRTYIEDGLVAANLAAATVDLKEYGTSAKISNNDFNKSFNDYKSALQTNLNLDNNDIPKSKRIINSKVNIESFRIYNVISNDVHMTERSSTGSILNKVFPNSLGTIRTPDGVLIETTTIYSKIGFNIKGYIDNIHRVYKQNSVDVTDK